VRAGTRHLALAVDAVTRVARLPPSALGDVPRLLGAASEALSALGALDDRLLYVLSNARLLPESFHLETIAEPAC
jgi:chemotaxis signal transduction protein